MQIRKPLILLTWMSLLSACDSPDGLLLLPRNDLPATANATPETVSMTAAGRLNPRKQVQVAFFAVNERPEGGVSYTPLSTAKLVRLTFDGQFTLEADALQQAPVLTQSFRFLESGSHVLELSFQDPSQDIKIPLVVPEDTEVNVQMRVHLGFDSQGLIRDIQVGYDQNSDAIIDQSRPVFRSSDGLSYLTYLPDGQVREWVSPLEQVNTDAVTTGTLEAPLPPGSEKDARSENAQAPVPQTIAGNSEPAQVPLPPVEVPPVPEPQPLPLPAPPGL